MKTTTDCIGIREYLVRWGLQPHRETATHGIFLSPSVGLGVAGGKLGSERYDARMVVAAGVALRYDLTGTCSAGWRRR